MRFQPLDLSIFGGFLQHADAPHALGLLSARRERPRRGRAAKQSDARAAVHVWMAPAWQEITSRAAQKSLAVMCPASHDGFSVKG
jgi:hypothetical protein